MIYKRCSRCGKRLPAGTRCTECEDKMNRERHSYYDSHQRNREHAMIYSSSMWQKTREEVMHRFDGIDVYKFIMKGVVVPASIVHHITPLEDDESLKYRTENCIPVSASSHYEIHRAYDLGGEDKRKMQEVLHFCASEYLKKYC